MKARDYWRCLWRYGLWPTRDNLVRMRTWEKVFLMFPPEDPAPLRLHYPLEPSLTKMPWTCACGTLRATDQDQWDDPACHVCQTNCKFNRIQYRESSPVAVHANNLDEALRLVHQRRG